MDLFIITYYLLIILRRKGIYNMYSQTYLLTEQTASGSVVCTDICRNNLKSMYRLFECITFLECGTMALQHSTRLTERSLPVPRELKLTKVLKCKAHKS